MVEENGTAGRGWCQDAYLAWRVGGVLRWTNDDRQKSYIYWMIDIKKTSYHIPAVESAQMLVAESRLQSEVTLSNNR